MEMYADCAGNVTLVNDTVFVSNVYEVPADVGTSTGDIDYDGSVEVRGNVLTGYTVKATGDITVNGAVEGATLISGGKIVHKAWNARHGKRRYEGRGDIISNFIESPRYMQVEELSPMRSCTVMWRLQMKLLSMASAD